MTSQQQWKHEVASDLTAEGYEGWLLSRVPVWVISRHTTEPSAPVWVVSRHTTEPSASTRWFADDRADLAMQQFARECSDYVGTDSCLRMVKMLVPNYGSPRKITEHVDSDLDWVEALAPPVAAVWTRPNAEQED